MCIIIGMYVHLSLLTDGQSKSIIDYRVAPQLKITFNNIVFKIAFFKGQIFKNYLKSWKSNKLFKIGEKYINDFVWHLFT